MTVFDQFLVPAAARAAFEDAALYQHMFDFEAALAEAQAAEGIVPAAAAVTIASVCRAELYDLPALSAASAYAGSIAIPVVQQLRQTVALFDAASADAVHLGSTSQDMLDTAMACATQRSVSAIDAVLGRLIGALLGLADSHAETPVLARTLLQPASVGSFGLKALNWAEPLMRSRSRLAEAGREALALQLGGAIGTFDTAPALRGRGRAIAERVAGKLGVALPAAPWHTQRDDWLRLALEAAVLTGSLGKLATDLALMTQAEVAELGEPDGVGRGGSSAMPHKRNPVGAMTALAAAQRAPQRAATLLAAMGQEHERGLGNWQAELAEWPALFCGAHAAALALADVFDGVQVHVGRMRANIDALQGVVHAEAAASVLAVTIGRRAAQSLLAQASRSATQAQEPLQANVAALVAQDAQLRSSVSGEALRDAFDPLHAMAPATAQLRRRLPALLASHEATSHSIDRP